VRARPVATAALAILMVAPQPFFRPRGTPFSVLHRARALTALGHEVDLITYPFGDDVEMPNLTIRRSARVLGVRDVKIGPSFGKFLLDIPLCFSTVAALGRRRYDVIHSHEEAAFFCAPLARKHGVTHVYDMHSSLPQQLDNFASFNARPIKSTFHRLENYVLRSCDGVITICKDLADVAQAVCPDTPHAMIENTGDDGHVFQGNPENVRAKWGLERHDVVLYAGTFEPYQGLDLLLEAFAIVAQRQPSAHLLMVGGQPEQVRAHEARAQELALAGRVTFTGQLHPSSIPSYMQASSVIVSPRSSGTNTPLKIYSYLRSGVPIVATDLPTHTQTLNAEVAELTAATPEAFAHGLARVLTDKAYAHRLAQAARELAEREYSDAAYMRRVSAFYSQVTAKRDERLAG